MKDAWEHWESQLLSPHNTCWRNQALQQRRSFARLHRYLEELNSGAWAFKSLLWTLIPTLSFESLESVSQLFMCLHFSQLARCLFWQNCILSIFNFFLNFEIIIWLQWSILFYLSLLSFKLMVFFFINYYYMCVDVYTSIFLNITCPVHTMLLVHMFLGVTIWHCTIYW